MSKKSMTKKIEEMDKKSSNAPKFNALKHGLWSRHICIEDGDKDVLKSIRLGLKEEWKPEGESERELVRTIAYLMLRKHQLLKYYDETSKELQSMLEESYSAASRIGDIRQKLSTPCFLRTRSRN